jgi:ketosteroid isomerase-like protein
MLYIAVIPESSAHATERTGPSADGVDSRAVTVQRYFTAIESGDYADLEAILTPDAVTLWPQSGEQITGALTCIRVYESYPTGPPAVRVTRVRGEGALRVAELVADYGEDRWYITSILEFEGERIARITDYFGPTIPAPEWRREYVDPVDPGTSPR